MGREESFLNRIASLGAARQSTPTTAENIDALIESVRQNLARLLNARHGLSEALPQYGLPALTELTMGGRNHVQSVAEAIRGTIERYEPRLRSVRVTRNEEAESRLELNFRIEGVLIGRSGEHRVWYDASLDTRGGFEVTG